MKPMIENTENKKFIDEVIFIKEMIKNLEDTIYYYYPKKHSDVLPFLHYAYDKMALIQYRLTK